MLAIVLITGATVTGYLVSEGQSARTFAAQTNLSRAPIRRYLTAVEQERAISLLAIGGDSQALAGLSAQWKSTDAANVGINHMRATLGGLDPQVMAAGAAGSAKLLARLSAIRQVVQAGRASVSEVDSYYTQVANVGMGTFLLYGPRTPDSGAGKITTTVALDFGRITISPQIVLYLFGTPGQERYWFMWKELSVGVLGAVVLADTRRLGDSFGALDFFESRDIPFIVAVNCFDGADIYGEDEVRHALDIGAHVPVQFCDARDRASGRQVLIRPLEHLMAIATEPAHARQW